jgi:hypothetical protein
MIKLFSSTTKNYSKTHKSTTRNVHQIYDLTVVQGENKLTLGTRFLVRNYDALTR